MAIATNLLAAALLLGAALAFVRRRPVLLVFCGACFVPAAGAGAVLAFWGWSAPATVILLALTLGVSLLGLLLYVIDRIWAPFCLEMTYAALLCWVLWPVLVAINLAGSVVVLLLRAPG